MGHWSGPLLLFSFLSKNSFAQGCIERLPRRGLSIRAGESLEAAQGLKCSVGEHRAVGGWRVCHVAFYCTSSSALEGCNLERKAASCFEHSLYLQHKAAFGKREERRGCSGTLRDAYGWRIKLKRILTAKQRCRVENGNGPDLDDLLGR